MDNYREMMRIFTNENQSRLADVKQRVRSESGHWQGSVMSWEGTPGPIGGRMMTAAEWDAALAARDPNHIKGLVTVGTDVPSGRMIDLPEHMVQGVQDLVRLQFAQILSGERLRNNHGDEIAMLQRSFLREIPVQDRRNAMFTMSQIDQAERQRIESAVREAVPGWQRGMRVSSEIIASILNGGGGRTYHA
jgi:hypothetical protein